jgi:hypothetical protein
MQQVHLRINDAATGQPTPARLRITDAAGTYYAPFGRLTEFATGVNQDVGGNVQIGAKKWCYIDGACEILLPPGQLHIEIAKGFEYKPIDETIELIAGKMSLRFTIERWCDMRKEGWYSGDTRVHFMSPDAALLEGQAEDVAVVNLLVCATEITDQFGKRHQAIPNVPSFSGQSFARQANGYGVAVNTHNRHRDLGSLGLLHCHRLVYPLTFDTNDWTLDDWCGQCHRKKGLVVWTNPLHETAEFLYGEPLADAMLGNIDAFELTFYEDSPFDALSDYYNLIETGLAPTLVGASTKDSNGIHVGSMRTYVKIPANNDFTYANWIEGIRQGRTYVSNGPLLTFTVDGASFIGMGTVQATSLRLHAEAKCLRPFDCLEWLWNGEPIATAQPVDSFPFHATLDLELTIKESGWLALRCSGRASIPSRPVPQRIFAHSSAILVQAKGQPIRLRCDVVRRLVAEINLLSDWAQKKGHVRAAHIFDSARTVLAEKLSLSSSGN